MAVDQRRAEVAARVRALGHDFVARSLSDEQLDVALVALNQLSEIIASAEARVRTFPKVDLANFTMAVAREDPAEHRHLFSDSYVAGATNPLGLGASAHRDGDDALMDVTLGRAFEGAPGRAHGGVVAALIDETMGYALATHGVLAFTGQLDITYLAPTPIDEALRARAWLKRRTHRKLFVEASVHARDVEVARASALFIAVDPTTLLQQLTPEP